MLIYLGYVRLPFLVIALCILSACGTDPEPVSAAPTGQYSVNLTGRTATSTITKDNCPNSVAGGWAYTFTSTGMTMVGTDTFISDGLGGPCTLGPEETLILTHAEIKALNDIPFNCGGDHICTDSDLNKVISGVDQDGRAFTSTYSHIQGSNTFTYVDEKTQGGVVTDVFTEVITLDPSVLGGWMIDTNTVLIFANSNLFIQAQANDGGVGGQPGVEHGTYTWNRNPVSREFLPDVYADTNGEWGLSHESGLLTVSVSGDTLTLSSSVAGDTVMTRINSSSNPIVGSWSFSELDNGELVTLTFTAAGDYIHTQIAGDSNGMAGIETGTYTWDPETSVFTSTVVTDTNGQWGLTHSKGIITITINGDTMTLVDSIDGSVTLTRVH